MREERGTHSVVVPTKIKGWAIRRSLLFNVSPFDPLVLALTAIFVMLLASVAALLPAMRAASIQPMKALRMD